MKTTALDADSIDSQMHSNAAGDRSMQIGKGSSASTKPADAVDTPAANKPAANTTRRLQDANSTKVSADKTANKTKDDSWKKLKSEDEFMRVVVNKKMFEKGGPLFGIKKPIIMFNKHGADYVAEFPKGKKDSFDPKTGKKKNATKPATADAKDAKPKNGSTVEEGDEDLNDTVANQVFELEFINGETMEEIPIKNLTKGMLKICMMAKDKNQKVQYVNEDNDQFQDDGITEETSKQISTKDETNQKERKGYEKCVDLAHATTFATIDGDSASSSLFSYSMMVLMTLLAVLFFK